jgi:precorrin-3B C17-methyltransferase
VIASGMGQEIGRVKEAIRLAQSGKVVALISGGDAGLYGMAGPVFEVLKNDKILKEDYPLIEVVPGIAGLNAAASLLGAPLMHDFASISLSDLLTPWKLIEKRLHAAAQADFVIIIYNPKSKGRAWQIDYAKKIILKYRKSNTPAGIVENACREGEKIILSNLEEFTKNKIGMRSIIIIGNSQSYTLGNFMITPRGYKL